MLVLCVPVVCSVRVFVLYPCFCPVGLIFMKALSTVKNEVILSTPSIKYCTQILTQTSADAKHATADSKARRRGPLLLHASPPSHRTTASTAIRSPPAPHTTSNRNARRWRAVSSRSESTNHILPPLAAAAQPSSPDQRNPTFPPPTLQSHHSCVERIAQWAGSSPVPTRRCRGRFL